MRTARTAALSAVFFGTAARADIVHSLNPAPGQPGHYDWRFEPVAGWQSWLDITLAPGLQSGVPSVNAVGQSWHPWGNAHEQDPAAPGQRAFVMALFGIVPGTAALSFGDPLVDGFEVGFHEGALHAGGGASQFAEDEPAYLGVKTVGGNLGWIKVVRSGMSLVALEWAYETQPGAAMYAGQVPAPGSAVLPGIVALGAGFRRRRA